MLRRWLVLLLLPLGFEGCEASANSSELFLAPFFALELLWRPLLARSGNWFRWWYQFTAFGAGHDLRGTARTVGPRCGLGVGTLACLVKFCLCISLDLRRCGNSFHTAQTRAKLGELTLEPLRISILLELAHSHRNGLNSLRNVTVTFPIRGVNARINVFHLVAEHVVLPSVLVKLRFQRLQPCGRLLYPLTEVCGKAGDFLS
mmetsp:Transcript_8493/g.27003  ORF Transcript_8493/g.27003 Transcript_8493/m.27003 type:complete len:203 (-) Transcript_8493:491-1099(-)